jgi:hypothetical protein
VAGERIQNLCTKFATQYGGISCIDFLENYAFKVQNEI